MSARYYLPDEIDEHYLEHVTGCLESDLQTVIENPGDPNAIDDARETLAHIGAVIEQMEQEGSSCC